MPGETDLHKTLKKEACRWLYRMGYRCIAAEVRLKPIGIVDAVGTGNFRPFHNYLFIPRELPQASTSLTTSELLAATAGVASVPRDRLAALLGETDLVKFARRTVTPDRARELGREAQAIARHVHDVEHAPPAAAAPAPAEAA